MRHRREIARLLFDAGADLTRTSRAGHTRLHSAAASGEVDIARLILRGALVDASAVDGATPLSAAASSGRAEVAQLLLDPDAKTKRQCIARGGSGRASD